MDVLPLVPNNASQEASAPPREARKKEKRKSDRHPLSGSLTILWGTNSHEERVSRANLIDISARGAKFRLAERIPSGSWLMFNHHQVGVSGRGTVRHCQMVKSAYHIGVEFSGGTGWNPPVTGFSAELRNLGAAVGLLQTAPDSEESAD